MMCALARSQPAPQQKEKEEARHGSAFAYPPRVPLLFVLALGGCALIDQNTFFSPLPAPVATIPTPKPTLLPAGPTPLVTIRLPVPPESYAEPLQRAVWAALARKPSVAFEVVLAVPRTADLARDLNRTTASLPEAQAVMGTIIAAGVSPDRIRLAGETMATLPGEELLIYVR